MSPEENLKKLIEDHNIAYDFASGRAYQEGVESYKAIQEARKGVSREVYIKLWNDSVKKKVQEHSWDDFMIKESV